jgi:hypothetical protein
VEDAVSGLNPKDKDEMIAIGVQVIPAETVLNNIVELRESSRQP